MPCSPPRPHCRTEGLIAPDAGRQPSAISSLWKCPRLKSCLAFGSHIHSGPCGDTKAQPLTPAWDTPEGPSQLWSSLWGWLRPVEASPAQQGPQHPPACRPGAQPAALREGQHHRARGAVGERVVSRARFTLKRETEKETSISAMLVVFVRAPKPIS